ncbi:hypothetical protein HQ447_00150 [bacterium]|nr:hypothetical protein [bacterium]
MKLHTQLTVIGSIAALAASPVALANQEAAAKPDAAEVQVTEAEPEVSVYDEVVVNEKSTDEVVTGGVTEEPVVDIEEGTVEVADGGAVPLDWVKRGGGENPEIFYNMAGGGSPAFKNETSAKDLGQDEKATDIEAQQAPTVSSVNREKKAPVALVKKGRVFLR